ncbi:MAG: uridine kinase [Actinomycetota bacterium]
MHPDQAASRPIVVGIAGGSGSGKTTIAQALAASLPKVALIQHDAYYRHRPDLSFEERTQLNYDHPDSLETELLIEHLHQLRRGQPIARPSYDFTIHLRAKSAEAIEPAPVVIIDGILVLALADLRAEIDLRVFVDTEADVRLARRLQRDIRERGRTLESVLVQYFQTVKPMYLQYVEPSKGLADLIIPGGSSQPAVSNVVELLEALLDGQHPERPQRREAGSIYSPP